MYCPKCGAQIPDGSISCGNCKMIIPSPPSQPPDFSAFPPHGNFPRPPGASMAPPFSRPQDYLTHNIIITVISALSCSCLNLATKIIGIIFAPNARNAFARGDYAAGASAAKTARILFIVSLAFAVLVIITIIFYAASVFYLFGTGGGARLPGIPHRI